MEQNAQAFDNAISWVETARENFDALGQIVKDVAEALEITDLRDFDHSSETEGLGGMRPPDPGAPKG